VLWFFLLDKQLPSLPLVTGRWGITPRIAWIAVIGALSRPRMSLGALSSFITPSLTSGARRADPFVRPTPSVTWESRAYITITSGKAPEILATKDHKEHKKFCDLMQATWAFGIGTGQNFLRI